MQSNALPLSYTPFSFWFNLPSLLFVHIFWLCLLPFIIFKKSMYFCLCCVFVAVPAFSSCSEWGFLFVAILELLIAVASLVAEHRL